jgi:hypothetical protein
MGLQLVITALKKQHGSFTGAEIPTSSDNRGNCTHWTQLVFCQTHTSSHGSFQLKFRDRFRKCFVIFTIYSKTVKRHIMWVVSWPTYIKSAKDNILNKF